MLTGTSVTDEPAVGPAGARCRPAWLPRAAHYALLLLLNARAFWPAGVGRGGDWWNLVFPAADALRRTVLHYHQFPWWNPWAAGGTPYFADPQFAVLSPDTLLVLALGPVLGLQTAFALYLVVGYEGTRALCRHLFARDADPDAARFLDWICVLPMVVPAAAQHFAAGHYCFVPYYLFPWLLLLGLTWSGSPRRSLALGLLAGYLLLSYPHYMAIISLSIVGAVVLAGAGRERRAGSTGRLLGLMGVAALALSFTRLAVAAQWVLGFPRDAVHYPIAVDPLLAAASLLAPFSTGSTLGVADLSDGGLGWWEIGSYLGVSTFAVVCLGVRWSRRRLMPWLLTGAFLFLLAWNSRCPLCPSHWLHFIPPWASLLIITRWRLFACWFVLMGAVQALALASSAGRRRAACALAAFMLLDLGVHVALAWRACPVMRVPVVAAAADPPRSARSGPSEYWPNLRRNKASLDAASPILGYRHHVARAGLGEPGYVGEVAGRFPVDVVQWTPNRVVLRGRPGDVATLNANPGSYWRANGIRLFPRTRPVEPAMPFRVALPASGVVTLDARPPYLGVFVALQAMLILFAAWLRAGRRLW